MRIAWVGLIVAVFVGVTLSSPVPQGTAKWVTLKGKVVWPANKTIPEPKFHDITPKHPDGVYTLQGGPVLDDNVLVHHRTNGLKNAVIWLRPDSDKPNADAPFPRDAIHPDLLKPRPREHVVTSKYCRYDRRILVARAGDTIEFVNNGTVADNVRFSGTDIDFNVLLAVGKSHVSDPFKAERVSIKVFNSNIHPWMQGYVRVFDHPYYAITDDQGNFEMKQVPVGKWRIVYWHELGWHKGLAGNRGYAIEVKDDGSAKWALPPLEYLPPEK